MCVIYITQAYTQRMNRNFVDAGAGSGGVVGATEYMLHFISHDDTGQCPMGVVLLCRDASCFSCTTRVMGS